MNTYIGFSVQRTEPLFIFHSFVLLVNFLKCPLLVVYFIFPFKFLAFLHHLTSKKWSGVDLLEDLRICQKQLK
jgi:hypothetical protein